MSLLRADEEALTFLTLVMALVGAVVLLMLVGTGIGIGIGKLSPLSG